jgi:uncharacterized membrane protein
LGSEDFMTLAIAASAPPLAQVSQIFSTRQWPSLFWPLSAIDSYFSLIVAYSNCFTLHKHNSGVWDMPPAMTTSKSSGLSISWFFSSFYFACAVIVPGFDGWNQIVLEWLTMLVSVYRWDQVECLWRSWQKISRLVRCVSIVLFNNCHFSF